LFSDRQAGFRRRRYIRVAPFELGGARINLLEIITRLYFQLISALRDREIIVARVLEFFRGGAARTSEPFAPRVVVGVISFAFYRLSKPSRDLEEKSVRLFLGVLFVRHATTGTRLKGGKERLASILNPCAIKLC